MGSSMAHFAKIEDGLVVEVLVAEQEFIDTMDGEWVQTSYNTRGGEHTQGGEPLRGNFAGIGFTYDSGLDAFYPPQPFPSWSLNKQSFMWEPPVPMPDDEHSYTWDEAALRWVPYTLGRD